MPWFSPITAAIGDVYTAVWYNSQTRDNLRETAAAKASLDGQVFVGIAANEVKPLVAFDGNDRLLYSRGGGYIHGLPPGAPSRSDYVAFSNESETGDPNQRATVATILGLLELADGPFDPVTYGTLDAAGDVGTSAGQLAIGNHGH